MKTAAQILSSLRITTKSSRDSFVTNCPQCSSNQRNKKRNPLSVKLDRTGVVWRCHYCGWHGGEQYDGHQRVSDAVVEHKPASPSATLPPVWPRLWKESESIAGTPAAEYLRSRSLDPERWRDGTVLRFHPRCPYGEKTRRPCMIALLRDIYTNEPRAIQRTALTPGGEKIGRLTLGPKTGAAVKLSPDDIVEQGLAIGEGTETTMSAMQQFGFRPAWAVGDANGMTSFPVLAGVEGLTLLVDRDKAGLDAAEVCTERWTAAGREVLRVISPRDRDGDDLNDLMRGAA